MGNYSEYKLNQLSMLIHIEKILKNIPDEFSSIMFIDNLITRIEKDHLDLYLDNTEPQIDTTKIKTEIDNVLTNNSMVKMFLPMLNTMSKGKSKISFDKLIANLPDLIAEVSRTPKGVELLKTIGIYDELKNNVT